VKTWSPSARRATTAERRRQLGWIPYVAARRRQTTRGATRRLGRCAALLAGLVLACAAAPASAAGSFSGTLAITSIAQPAAAGDPVAVAAQGTVSQSCGTSSCGYFPFVSTVPAAQVCDRTGSGPGWVGDAYDTNEGVVPQSISPSWTETAAGAPVQRRACLYANRGFEDQLVAEALYTVPGPPTTGTQPPPPPPPSGDTDISRRPIPRWIGVRRPWPFRISTVGIPPDVDPARFVALVKAAGARWGLPYAGTARHEPRVRDGRNTVGFAFDVPRGALGVTSVQAIVYLRPGRIVCEAGRCHRGKPRVVRRRIVEQDMRLAYAPPWEDGPGLPDAAHFDLQTVILHELGHYAGNRHARNCANTPMWVALSMGEWWHTPAEWFQRGCRTSAAAAASAGAEPDRRRLLVRVHVRRVLLR
jgi:hypothetical protein